MNTSTLPAGSPALPRPGGAELRLLVVALIWGLDFVAQRQGVLDSGPFLFNAASFTLGTLVLLLRGGFTAVRCDTRSRVAGVLAGIVLFLALSFQSRGMATTGAGKAAFITSLYIVLVPLGGRILGQRPGSSTWAGCALAATGLWFLCVRGDLSFTPGDLLVLACSLFWALHILLVARVGAGITSSGMAFWQFTTCATLSWVLSGTTENPSFAALREGFLPVLYNGILSAGVAYSLQITGQRGTTASRAALILSLETVFAAAGGAFLLHERFGGRELLGSLLMLFGVLASRLGKPVPETQAPEERVHSSSESEYR